MVTVNAKELKNRTGRILRLVSEGQVVLITKNRKPLAKVTPLTNEDLEKLNLRPFDIAWQGIERTLGTSKPQFKSLAEAMRWSRNRR
jgi:prevent-host-death family protein